MYFNFVNVFKFKRTFIKSSCSCSCNYSDRFTNISNKSVRLYNKWKDGQIDPPPHGSNRVVRRPGTMEISIIDLVEVRSQGVRPV